MTNVDICKNIKILESHGFTKIRTNTHNEEVTFDATSPDGIRYLDISLGSLERDQNNKITFEMSFREAQSVGLDIAEARKIMRMAFENDSEPGGLKHAYVSNIAMLLHDRYEITDYETRNEAAKDILKLIFWDN